MVFFGCDADHCLVDNAGKETEDIDDTDAVDVAVDDDEGDDNDEDDDDKVVESGWI
jgi:hypothetical protein